MYTRCPHCQTIFEITAEQLRRAAGDVDCVACGATFDAVETLADDVTLLIGAEELSAEELQPDDNFVGDDTTVVDEELAVSDLVPDTEDEAEDAAEDEDDASDTIIDEATGHGEPDEAAELDEDQTPEDLEEQTDGDEDTATQESPVSGDPPDSEEMDEALAAAPAEEQETDTEEAFVDDDDNELSEDAPSEDAEEVIAYDDDSELPEDHEDESQNVATSTDSETDNDDDRFDAVLFAAGRTAEELSDTEPGNTDNPSSDELEFNAPEQTWTRYFLTDSENVSPNRDRNQDETANEPWIGSDEGDDETNELEFATADPDEWQSLLEELDTGQTRGQQTAGADTDVEEADFPGFDEAVDDFPADAAALADDPAAAPLWFEDEVAEPDRPAEERKYLYGGIGLCLVLLLTLAGQLIHYNRDQLAGDPIYGAPVRGIYAALGATLYPDWPLEVFEVTGTEAIAGRTSAGTLDVLANVVVSGSQPVGLPSIRIVLNDRWGTPLASRVFAPAEYLRTYNPAEPLVRPGAALPVEVSVADPGTDALGYIVDVCLPRRKTGLECQISRDPFQ